jgi:hypothetical protein
MKALQKGGSRSAAEDRRERERIREEKEMQRIMGVPGNSIPPATSGVKSISLNAKPGFKKITTTNVTTEESGGTGWTTVSVIPTKAEAELAWGNNGEDLYDPAYPTPA